MRIDTTAASDPAVIGAKLAPVVCSEMEPTAPANPHGLDLHAFTHCPDCKAIMHRETGCTACNPALTPFPATRKAQ